MLGIGSTLIKALPRRAETAGCPGLLLTVSRRNSVAVHLYERVGFVHRGGPATGFDDGVAPGRPVKAELAPGQIVDRTSDIEVRVADAADIPALAGLRSTWTGALTQNDDLEVRMAAWLSAEGDRRTTFLATLADRVVGMASLFEYRRMPRPGRPDSRWRYVSSTFVLEESRNRAIGYALLKAIIDAADERRYARLVLSPSQEAIAFYRRAGFIVPDERAGDDRLLVRFARLGGGVQRTDENAGDEPHEPRRNVELKAWDRSPDRSLEVCRHLRGEDNGELRQRDTYFNVPKGRLKLREQHPGYAQLIQYDRPDQPQQRESRYRLVEITDLPAVMAALAGSLGVRCTVTKRRRLFLWRGVRIHLDDVERLGAFVELEAVAQPGSDLTREDALIRELRTLLSITDDRLVPESYAEQITRRRSDPP